MELDRSFVNGNCVDCTFAQACLRKVEDKVEDVNAAEREIEATEHRKNQIFYQSREHTVANSLPSEAIGELGLETGSEVTDVKLILDAASAVSDEVRSLTPADLLKLLLRGATNHGRLLKARKNAEYEVERVKSEYQNNTLACPGPRELFAIGSSTLALCESRRIFAFSPKRLRRIKKSKNKNE